MQPRPQPARQPPAPPTRPGDLPGETGDSTRGIIPYKNPAALFAYYLGLFSILPFFPIGLAALSLGIAGLKARAKNPVIKGAVHAWIGIVLGGFFGLVWLAATALVIWARMQ